MRWTQFRDPVRELNLNLLHKKSNTLRVADMKRMNFLRCNCDVHVARDQRLGEGNYGVVMLVVEAIFKKFDRIKKILKDF